VPGARCPCGQGIADSASHEHADFGYRGEMTVGSMLYLCARDYDPSVGRRVTTSNPITTYAGRTDVHSTYACANNDPLNVIDPSGEIGFGAPVGSLLATMATALAAVNRTGRVVACYARYGRALHSNSASPAVWPSCASVHIASTAFG
jgi:RHS repeat-associated protein